MTVSSRRALLSVSDKTGIVEFARGLVSLGFEIVSTGGTAKALKAAGVAVTPVEEATGFPEMMGGRVKTLHPAIHGGILFLRGDPEHEKSARAHGIVPIDVVAVNLYPFVRTVRSGASDAEVIEQMDIGGPATIRSAAKNHAHVLVVVRPERYGDILAALKSNKADPVFRRALATEAIRHTAAYDGSIAAYLGRADPAFPVETALALARAAGLRYGENPHQKGALYRDPLAPAGSVTSAEILAEGKGLSHCNWLDLDAAWQGAMELARPGQVACVVVKHAIPCGAALAGSPREALERAWATDPVSAYGSVVSASGPMDAAALSILAAQDHFVEALIAPAYDVSALAELTNKRRNLRVLRCDPGLAVPPVEWRLISGGALAQDPDRVAWDRGKMATPTRMKIPAPLEADLEFAWRLVKHVRSNAIVLVKNRAAVGIGAGQVNRVDAVRIACWRAGERAKGAVLASDAFFPFADGVEEAIRVGVSAIVQPGGSIRDADAVAACDRSGIPMLFTGMRHFRH